MTYKEAVEYIHSLLKFGIKPGLQRISYALNRLGNPQNKLKVIHVAGTNGKGSTCAMISSILNETGYKTGLFISPYVINFRERIQISGEFISEQDLAEYTTKIKKIADQMSLKDLSLTEFEFITALALLYFYNKSCDYVVLETGLGGRLDSTNVVEKPLASVITKIDLDHTAILGNTIKEIAAEKGGIIKPDCPVVTTRAQNINAIDEIKIISKNNNSELVLADISDVHVFDSDFSGSSFTYRGSEFHLNMLGQHQIENAMLAIKTVETCRLPVSIENISAGLEKVCVPARMEIISKKPLVILDGAHNPSGAAVLSSAMHEYHGRITGVIGMMADKDYESTLKILAPIFKRIITVSVEGNTRSLSASELAVASKKHCSNTFAASSYDQALENAELYADESIILICGSLYLAGDIRNKAFNVFKKQ